MALSDVLRRASRLDDSRGANEEAERLLADKGSIERGARGRLGKGSNQHDAGPPAGPAICQPE